ncbi:iron complex outermembrane recepter protein [Sphingomonas laterariae]|uniref:Iron complex outermembrane recepter protein n=1 Tax=Edaphosphingomonas laterariae TaxID=861865 RepID=A0A239E4L6_9SPHN|nr:TonB-dependent receptor [Sphingomonas laterariae]SNS38892.1 iron complex outermembrane recepter protein [Sphingomonas laterariae]
MPAFPRRAAIRALTLTTLTGVSAIALAIPAAAQEGAEAERFDDIVVTAQKRTESLQDVPAAVSVVSALQFEQRGGVNIQSLQQLVPSLNFKDSATSLDSTLFLRGVGTINFSIAAEPSVGFVVDGVTYARAGEAFGDLYDVERIEVLRGPQGTLFGKNASAGVISVVTKRPGDEFGGYVEGTATTDEEYKIRAAVDLPISDTIKSRWTASYGWFDGTVRNITLDRTVNGYERYGIRGVVTAEATDNLSFTLIGDYRRMNSDCCAEVIGTLPAGALAGALDGVDVKGDATREIRQNTLTKTKETSWGVSLQGDLDVGSAGTLTSITAYRYYRNYGIRDGDFIDTVYSQGGGFQLDDFGPQPSKTFTQEIRLTSPGNQFIEYVIGGFYYWAKQERTFQRDDIVCTDTTLAPVAPGLTPCAAGSSTLTFPSAVGNFGSTFNNFAIYGNATINITDAFRVIAGGRYTHDDLKAFNVRTASAIAGPGVLAAAFDERFKVKNDDFSLRAGLQYDLTDDLMAYATYSQGYKGPAFNVFFNQNLNQRDPLKPETSDAFEAGAKFRTADGAFTLNTALFHAKYKNFQANGFVEIGTPPNVSTVTQLTNAGTIITQGVEIESVIRPTRNFTLQIGMAYTDAEIDRFNITQPGQSDRHGEQLPLAPKWKGNASALYTIETGGFADVEIGGQISLTSDQVSTLEANPVTRRAITIDGYAIVDANIALVDPNGVWRLNFIGRNLTDTSYATLITPGGPGGSYRYLLPRDVDRYFGAQLRYNF